MSDLLPIVVGGVLALAGGASTELLRNRQSQAKDRQQRKQLRDDFQRQTLIDLQDALQSYVRGIGAAVHFDHMTDREHGKQFLLPDDLSDRIHEAQVLTMKLATRAVDDQTRAWISEVIEMGSAAVLPGTAEPQARMQELGETATEAQARMGTAIRSL
jgi:hypothetical protein